MFLKFFWKWAWSPGDKDKIQNCGCVLVAAGVMSYSGSIRVSVSRYNEQCCLGWVHPHAGPQCGDRGKKAEITVSSKQAATGDTGQPGEMVVALWLNNISDSLWTSRPRYGVSEVQWRNVVNACALTLNDYYVMFRAEKVKLHAMKCC